MLTVGFRGPSVVLLQLSALLRMRDYSPYKCMLPVLYLGYQYWYSSQNVKLNKSKIHLPMVAQTL